MKIKILKSIMDWSNEGKTSICMFFINNEDVEDLIKELPPIYKAESVQVNNTYTQIKITKQRTYPVFAVIDNGDGIEREMVFIDPKTFE